MTRAALAIAMLALMACGRHERSELTRAERYDPARRAVVAESLATMHFMACPDTMYGNPRPPAIER